MGSSQSLSELTPRWLPCAKVPHPVILSKLGPEEAIAPTVAALVLECVYRGSDAPKGETGITGEVSWQSLSPHFCIIVG